MTPTSLPPCGLYRTALPIAGVPAGRLVYFHNHGDPGAGIYLPERWTNNRAHFSPQGTTLPAEFDPRSFEPLPREGFYRVTAAFHCCDKQCVRFEPEAFVQLGYNGEGRPLLFVPELASGGIGVPERGTFVDDAVLPNLVALRVAERSGGPDATARPRGASVH